VKGGGAGNDWGEGEKEGGVRGGGVQNTMRALLVCVYVRESTHGPTRASTLSPGKRSRHGSRTCVAASRKLDGKLTDELLLLKPLPFQLECPVGQKSRGPGPIPGWPACPLGPA
jgi:hypothetical protein